VVCASDRTNHGQTNEDTTNHVELQTPGVCRARQDVTLTLTLSLTLSLSLTHSRSRCHSQVCAAPDKTASKALLEILFREGGSSDWSRLSLSLSPSLARSLALSLALSLSRSLALALSL